MNGELAGAGLKGFACAGGVNGELAGAGLKGFAWDGGVNGELAGAVLKVSIGATLSVVMDGGALKGPGACIALG